MYVVDYWGNLNEAYTNHNWVGCGALIETFGGHLSNLRFTKTLTKTFIKQGVSHIVALPFTFKTWLKAKENLWKLK
jgi:hypothetical protein